MKKILITLLIASMSYAQSGFKVVEDQIVWEKVYHGDHNSITKNSILSELEKHDDYWTAFLYNVPNLYRENRPKGAGAGLAYHIAGIKSAKVLIEIKEDRYRITVSNIQLDLDPRLGSDFTSFGYNARKKKLSLMFNRSIRNTNENMETIFDKILINEFKTKVRTDF